MSDDARPLPALTALNRPFFEGTAQGELRLQRCDACQHRWYPPAPACPNCLGTSWQWLPVSGRGRLWSWIVMYQPYFKAFETKLPYVVGFVKLDEGPYMIAGLAGMQDGALRCDLPLEVTFERATDDIVLPLFRPASS